MKKYLKNGQEVVQIRELDDCYLVSDVMFNDCGDGYNAEWVDEIVYFVDEVFDNSPQHKYHSEIQKVLDQIEQLKKTKAQLGKNINALRDKQMTLQNQIAKIKQPQIRMGF